MIGRIIKLNLGFENRDSAPRQSAGSAKPEQGFLNIIGGSASAGKIVLLTLYAA